MSGDKNQELLTASALAEALNLSVETIWKYTRENKIPCVKLGGKQYRYRLLEVIRALSDHSDYSGHSVQEEQPVYQVDSTKKYTYQDYLKLPEEPGYRYEVLEGVLVKDPSPNVMHQRVSRRLIRVLEDYINEIDPEGEVFFAPLDVTFQEITVVQPDLFYISGEQKKLVEEARIDGPPTLVVEIISPSTSRKDRIQKRNIYQKAGVQHYWLIHPEERTLECFALRDGVYSLIASGMDEDVVEHPDFPGLTISLKTLW